jgi:hypothetical protein
VTTVRMEHGGWHAPGVTPDVGATYEFEDFVGGRFSGTVSRLVLDHPEHEPIRIEFEDGTSFETNLPLRFRDA